MSLFTVCGLSFLYNRKKIIDVRTNLEKITIFSFIPCQDQKLNKFSLQFIKFNLFDLYFLINLELKHSNFLLIKKTNK
ncbi:hypothetical protein BpHYR1_027169 [Brachionus plicatilis]|uniref:Uncharacterized protein n=1 Tax=Brachionus plicatilis TaxID=10195 RepID=A0A3M7QGI5_BRAPC|nr:hypothetical protein BpHYR1_027169 [Brachionus plicatilis]